MSEETAQDAAKELAQVDLRFSMHAIKTSSSLVTLRWLVGILIVLLVGNLGLSVAILWKLSR